MNMQAALELKPRGMGELLDVAVRLYRNNFWKLVGMWSKWFLLCRLQLFVRKTVGKASYAFSLFYLDI